MRSRLGMFAYYQKKEGGGQDPSPCPGGSGTNTLTYLLTELYRASFHSSVSKVFVPSMNSY